MGSELTADTRSGAASSRLVPARDLVAAWLTGYRGQTREAYGRDMRDFTTWCDDHRLELLTVQRAHIELYARDLEERRGRAPATVSRRLAALASFYRYLVDEDVLSRSPADRVRRPRVSDESSTLGLDRDELAQLLEVARASGPRDHALVCLLALNGLRISEALAIDVGDVRSERGHQVIRIRRKGGKTALVPLASTTAAAVRHLSDSQVATNGGVASCINLHHRSAAREAEHGGDSKNLNGPASPQRIGPLFLGAAGERLDRHVAYQVIRRLAETAGIAKRISPHSLRHTFATLALDAGVPLRDLQIAMSHSDPRTTTRYDRARENLDRAATFRLTRFLEE